MTWIKRGLITIAVGIAGLLVGLGLMISWAVNNVESAWRLIERHVLPPDMAISWERIDFAGRRTSGAEFDLSLDVAGLKVVKDDPRINVSVRELHVRANVTPFSPKPKIRVRELRVVAPDAGLVGLTRSRRSSVERNPYERVNFLLQAARKGLKWTEFGETQIEVTGLEVAASPPVILSLRVERDNFTDEEIQIRAEAAPRAGAQPWLELDAVIRPTELRAGGDAVNMRAHLSIDPGASADVTMSLNVAENMMIVRGDGNLDFMRGELRLQAAAKVHAILTPEKADVDVSSRISGLPGGISRIQDLTARLTVPFEEARLWSGRPVTFKVDAPVALFFVDKKMRAPLEKACQCKIPEVVEFKAEGKLWPDVLVSHPREETPVLAARIEAETVNNKLISVDLAGDITVRKRGSEFLYAPAIDTRILIHSYQGIRRFLDAKGILIPSPFDVLEGVVALSARGPVSFEGDRYVLPAKVSVDIASARQKVKIDSTVTTTVNAAFTTADVDVKVFIDALQIELPPLDPLRGKPRVLTDKRILSLPPPRRKIAPRFKLTASVQAETRSPGAIRLLGPYFKPYLPVTLKVERDGKKDTEGFIRAEPFEIDYLRRVMRVERMRIDLSRAEDGAFPVDGRLRIRQTHYTVFIDIAGVTNRPSISLSSDPYLPESEIISVLLYDRTSDQLISADANTAGGVQAAVADRAIGLFGLWAFASTPIRSFSYDPATKVYKATVAITKDTTAAIGTDWEDATHLELRKRVSRRWVLTAAWTPATQDEEQKTTLTLQWERRY